MSRQIENDHPFTEDEIAYLLTRAGGASIVADNKRDFPANKPAIVELDADIVKRVKELDAEKVSEILAQRKVSVEGKEVKEQRLELARILQADRNADK